MEALLVWSWDGVHPGRGEASRKLAHDMEAFWAEHAKAGRSSAVEWLGNLGNTAPSMSMVRGDFQTLAGISMSPEGQRHAMRAIQILTNAKQSWYVPGASADTLWATWYEVMEELEGTAAR
jgi:hypothetical protein